jgi:hypothetical protein
MLFNRTFIKPIFQTSKLNREKFVKNKKLYNVSIINNRQNNYNKFVTRKMSSYSQQGASFYGGGGGGGGPNWFQSIIYMFIVAFSCNISSKLIKNANSKQE